MNKPFVAISTVIIILILVGGVFEYKNITLNHNKKTSSQTKEFKIYEFDVDEIVPPDKKYPPPSKKQRSFSKIYTARDIQYSIAWSNRNVNRNPIIGNHVFTLELYNTLNKNVSISGNESSAISFGCAALDNPYRYSQITPQAYSFLPYEHKKIRLEIDVSCLYIGTADTEYFWRIY